MNEYPFYDITTSYDIGDRFHYGNADYETIKPIHSGDKLVIYDENISPDGNVILLS